MKKKIINLFIALVAVLSINVLSVNAEEATKIAITIKGATDAHKYEAYQVFDGSTTTTNGQLINVKWGSGVEGDKIITELKKELCTTCETAQDVANWLDRNENSIEAVDDEVAKKFATIVGANLKDSETTKAVSSYDTGNQVHKIEVAKEGYYFVKDVSNLANTNQAYTRYILRVLGGNNVNEINVKADLPTIEEKVLNGTTPSASVIKEIGATVTYQLTATLPNTLADFAAYQLIFNDVLSDGLTYNVDSYDVKLYNEDSDPVSIKSHFALTTATEDSKVKLVFTATDIKKIANLDSDSIIVLTYTATVNNKALANVTGNVNSAYLVFSNNPNDGTGSSVGKTLPVSVTVFTYELKLEKQDGRHNETKLGNVGFKLCSDEGKTSCATWSKNTEGVYVLTGWTTFDKATEIFTDNTEGSTKGLANLRGLESKTYYLFETTPYEGYNSLVGATTVDMSNATNSIKAIKVDNYKGSLLPSTGGIGTVIFYVCGAILVGGAIIFIILYKKKKDKDEE